VLRCAIVKGICWSHWALAICTEISFKNFLTNSKGIDLCVASLIVKVALTVRSRRTTKEEKNSSEACREGKSCTYPLQNTGLLNLLIRLALGTSYPYKYKSRLSLIVRVNVVLNRTVTVDNLCGSHLQSQSELYHVSWWYYTLVIDLMNNFGRFGIKSEKMVIPRKVLIIFLLKKFKLDKSLHFKSYWNYRVLHTHSKRSSTTTPLCRMATEK